MANRELLRAPKETLSPSDRQRQYVLRVELTPVPCPTCQSPVDALAASGTEVDADDFGRSRRAYRCPGCRAELELVVPFVATGGPGWHWQLRHDWLADRLARARAYDREHPQEGP